MRIVDIRETAVPINSQIANSSFENPGLSEKPGSHDRRRNASALSGPSVVSEAFPAAEFAAVEEARAVEAPVRMAITPGEARMVALVAVPAAAVPMRAGRRRGQRGRT